MIDIEPSLHQTKFMKISTATFNNKAISAFYKAEVTMCVRATCVSRLFKSIVHVAVK